MVGHAEVEEDGGAGGLGCMREVGGQDDVHHSSPDQVFVSFFIIFEPLKQGWEITPADSVELSQYHES